MLLETTIKYRADTEIEAKEIIEKKREEANTKGFFIKKASYERKVKKLKGEIVAECFVVVITQVFGELWEGLI